MSRNSQVIVLNENNLVDGTNKTKYEYKFQNTQIFKNKEISLSQINLYYSWFNINAQLYNNNSFQYKWLDTSGNISSTSTTITFPDGYYDIGTINTYIKSVMKQNGHCLSKSNGDTIYFFEIRDNPTYYSFEIIITQFPTVLPSGYTSPSGWALPSVSKIFQLIINSTNNFNKLIGINPGSYGGVNSSTALIILSHFTPAISPITSLTMRCNLVRNELATVPDLLYSFTQGTSIYGNIISIEPKNPIWLKIGDGNYNSISVQFFDQLFRPIQLKDSDLLIILSMRDIE